MTKTPATLVFCGSADWDLTGRKKTTEEYPGPVIYTPTSQLSLVFATSSCASCHSVLIDGMLFCSLRRRWERIYIWKK